MKATTLPVKRSWFRPRPIAAGATLLLLLAWQGNRISQMSGGREEVFSRQWDFHAYYFAGVCVSQGGDPYHYGQLSAVAQRAGLTAILFPFVYPPAALLLILPLAALPLPAALAIWLVLQTLCFLIAVGGLVWLAARVSGRMWLAYLAAAACLAYDPWVNTVVTGQLNAIPLLFIVLGLVALRVRLPGVAGAAVAASLAAKPAGLLLPLAVLANPETRWRAAAGMAAALAAIGLVSTAVLPLQLYYSYYDTVTAKPALPGVSLGVNRIDAPANSSINGQVSFLAQVAGTERLTALECGRAAVFVMLIGAGAWFLFCRKRRPQIVAHDVQALEWSYWICVSLLALPNLWAHHFVLLLVPFAMISATLTRFPRRWWAWSALGLAYLLLAIPLTDIGLRLAALSQNPGWQRLWALAANPPFWGILVLWALNSHLLFSSQRQEKQWVPDIVV